MIIGRIIAVLIGYCFGMILMGYFIGKSKHIDLTKVGSGNVGSTNTMRNLGVPAGLITLLWDCFKCVVACFVVWLTYHRFFDDVSIYMVYAGLGTVLGHDFPCYMHFKGGKGVASTLGFIIALFPMGLPIPAVVFIALVALTRYVSLGSIIGCLSFAIEMLVGAYFGLVPFEGSELVEVLVICCFVSGLAILLHHANIKRLINGNENKFSFHPETRA
ncbi:glycerol-3-phosphate acyltransferase [Pseudobutyrivibrio xylanivorans]|uniref:Glycerol-3-phosphate acyltransferase n=1 Tax=Pseudobutyrivibrio xylanivorans DSM 14809 TaxID=1123012 RepID=A0A1M6EBJ1_PSEXY|nr:glycerol-3-phosphate acyltransferase [Pseudobutyrivibrio xylanivorans]SHI82660.1 glycerol-3-phosphate acyltransferase PlsY [Pseudobutyrivibrio xylanivorans DSM 14809]